MAANRASNAARQVQNSGSFELEFRSGCRAVLIESVFGIALLAMIWVGFRRWLQHKDKMGGLIAEQTATLKLVAAQLGERDWTTARAALDATDDSSMTVPSGSELARPFLPAKDITQSKSFYEALGFTKLLDIEEVAIFAVGESTFLLQNQFQNDWAGNFMMQLMVDDDQCRIPRSQFRHLGRERRGQ